MPDLIEQHGEFVAGQPRDAAIFLQPRHGVGGAQAVPQPCGEGFEQQVPSQVSQTVVDILEAVHIQQQDRKLARRGAACRSRSGAPAGP